MQKKVLVLGSAGMVGNVVYLYFKDQGHDVQDISFPVKAFENSYVHDVRDLPFLRALIQEHDFDMIINCVGLLIAASEGDKASAVFLNSYLPNWLEQEAAGTKTKIIQVGTSGVFGDTATRDEAAPHKNESFYARTKSLGEISNHKNLTVRSAFFGPDINANGGSLFNWFFTQLGLVEGYTDHIFTGVTSLEFAKFCHAKGWSVSGIYNMNAREPIDKYSLLKKIKGLFELDYIDLMPVAKGLHDTTAMSSRTDIDYPSKGYDQMLLELKAFMLLHKERYAHYFAR